MASIKISELEEVVTLSESDTLPITNEGDTKQVAISKLGDILATKEYVNKTISELADMGFTPVIVESLPTENIQTNTIYMILSEDGEGKNIYEEWMYINNVWEQVGSSGVNAAKFDDDQGLKRFYLTGNPSFSALSETIGKTTTLGASIVETTQRAYDEMEVGEKAIIIMTHPTYGLFKCYATKASETSFTFVDSYVVNATQIYSFRIMPVTISDGVLSFKNNYTGTATKTHIADSNKVYANFLSKTNTTSYTPSANYHPATKKYVDNAITSAITIALESDY